MDAIAEVLATILMGFVRLCVQLVASVLGAGFLASRRTGLARTGFLLIAASCAYFLLGIARFFVPALATPWLYGLYTWPLFLTAIAVFFVGAVLTGASRETVTQPQSVSADIAEGASQEAILGFGLFLVGAIIIVLTSIATTSRHQSSLRDTACDIYEGRVSETWRDRASEARDLAERLLDRQIAPDVTCSE